MAQKPESKFWKKVKSETPNIVWTRIENWASFGTPDLLGYNKNHHYFTVELKVMRSKKLSISPHQISYCFNHPVNHFILLTLHAPLSPKLYTGKEIFTHHASLESATPVAETWDGVRLCLEKI